MTLTDKSTRELVAAFRSSDPTPGGGSASALAGAVGAALITMVASLPNSRTGTEEEGARLAAAGASSAGLSEALTALVDRDSEAYDAVVAAFKRPKGTDAEKAERSVAIQEAYRIAIAAPLDVMRACAAAAGHALVAARIGNASAASDVRVAIGLLEAGLDGARANVEINLSSVKDAGYAETVRAEVARLGRGMEHDAAAVRAQLLTPA